MAESESASEETRAAPRTPEQLLAHLDATGVAYDLHRHPPLFTVEDSKALRGELPGGHCKNLFLRDRKGKMWLLVTLEDRPIDLKQLGAAFGGARLSFGSADRLMTYLGVIPGAVSPFALINDTGREVNVVLDKEMLEFDPLNYHPLSNEMTIAVSPAGLQAFLADLGYAPEILDLGALAE
ncbi:MAG: prolyl-tRNA synthetase associated domain-containing protein [Nisaea sp.]|jgi:Ala-tRNA(Pro) deacylase|uniref:prolyl-tRNA synthetase associated domain-containing protein n=1 Tax=Nisaea sp. TaxID=2024842 RepID=UPI001B050C7D|nr:prolyl-tRNA synthetase associated domain-containing protein [Nisaea sp.]MBO6561647.1 prolyl-tRNA synthetase associated domain-containing protein [Nisaea sp.]